MKVFRNTIKYIHTVILLCSDFAHSIIFCLRTYWNCNFDTPSLSHTIIILYLFNIITISSNPTSAYSKNIEIEEAKHLIAPLVHKKNVLLAKSTSAYYIFTTHDNSSFVIVANDDAIQQPILGYSESCGWIENKMPPLLLNWLDSLEYHNIRTTRQTNTIKTKGLDSDTKRNIPALITSHWHQDSPYNDLCPVITDGNIKTAAGCVAIASAQVAYYWRKDNPIATSAETPVYPYGKAPVTNSIPSGTDFQWNLMKDYYTLYESEEEKMAVARLVYIIGTSTYLQYGVSTGGQINDIITPFLKQFRLNAKYAAKRNYSQKEWELLIYNDLLKKQPIVYAGSTGSNGHAVVIDGYNANLNLYHFNFGWGGNGDGYYTIDDISGMNGYAIGQECIYDIYPHQRNINITLNVADLLSSNTEENIDIFVQNGSTFEINGLYLFISNHLIFPSNKDKAIWHQDEKICNNGSEYKFSAQFIPTCFGTNCYLILTDGDMNILTLKNISIQEGDAIKEVFINEEQSATYYSIKGEKILKPQSGIFIKKNKKQIRKIIVKK